MEYFVTVRYYSPFDKLRVGRFAGLQPPALRLRSGRSALKSVRRTDLPLARTSLTLMLSLSKHEAASVGPRS